MMDTLVIQSHSQPLPHEWLTRCLDSVRYWAAVQGFDYRFFGDEMFDPLDEEIRRRTRDQLVIASDLARLIRICEALDEGYQRVVWCDADFLIFDPASLQLIDNDFALGRETWVQDQRDGKFRAYVRVHNAFMFFRQGTSFLPFYLENAQRLVKLNTGRMVPQFIGPKLLSALHNIFHFPVQENAAMLSPLVLLSLLGNDSRPLALFRKHSAERPAGANLCSSLYAWGSVSEKQMQMAIDLLLETRGEVLFPGHENLARDSMVHGAG